MPTLTNDQLSATSFGYLSGSDLMQWVAAQLLIKAYEVRQTSLQDGCSMAYGEVIRALLNRYAIQDEMSNVSGTRDILIVKVTSILAVRNILGNVVGVSDLLASHYNWADETLRNLRLGFINAILPSATLTNKSDSFLVRQNFHTLG